MIEISQGGTKQIKKTVRSGNSSAVILPRSWLDKEVRVELIKKTSETILLEVIKVLREHLDLKEIIGIYLTGSYARGEEDENSDIDILVLTKDIDRKMIREGIYNILIISSELLKQKLENDLFPVGQMIKESKPLLNSEGINSIKVKVTKKNIKWYLDTTKDKLKIIKEVLDRKKNKKYLSDIVAYTLILRIRTLHIIEKLIKDEKYSKRDFIKLIKKISKGADAYERYLIIKNNQEDKIKTSIKDAEKLYGYLKEQFEKIKKSVDKL